MRHAILLDFGERPRKIIGLLTGDRIIEAHRSAVTVFDNHTPAGKRDLSMEIGFPHEFCSERVVADTIVTIAIRAAHAIEILSIHRRKSKHRILFTF